MSTKTTIKRIALVAAVAAAFGGLSTVAAHATTASFYISKYSAASSVVKCDQTATSNASTTFTSGGGTCLTGLAAGTGIWASGDSGYFGSISSVTSGTVAVLAAASPAQAHVPAHFYTGSPATTTVASGIIANAISGMTVSAGANAGLLLILDGATANTTAAGRVLINGQVISTGSVTSVATDTNMFVPFTAPIAAGSYTATVQFSNDGTYSGIGADTVTQTFALTVGAAHDLSLGLSTAYADAPGTAHGAGNYTATTNAIARSATYVSGTPIIGIETTLIKDDSNPDTQGETVTATVSGLGFVRVDTTAASGVAAATRVSTDATAASLRYVHVYSDGTTGTGTVTVSVTNINTAVTTTLGTWTYTTFGKATSLKVVTTNFTIGRAGYATGNGTIAARALTDEVGLTAGVTPLTAGVTTPAYVVEALDANGNPVNLVNGAGTPIVPSVVSSDSTVATGGTCVLDSGAATYGDSKNGVGFYNCNFSSATNAVSGKTATLTIKTPNPADATGATSLTTTLPVTIGGSVATTTMTTDAKTYAPGSQMLITFTATDSAGNPVYDGATSPAATFSSNLALSGSIAPFAGFYIGGVDASASSLAKSTTYAPAVAGNLTLTATGTDTAKTALTASAVISGGTTDTAANSATDAANQATDAANNAIDAANAAADTAQTAAEAAQSAADTATQALAAAQDADQNATDALSAAQEATDAGNAATDAANAAADSADAATAAAQDASDKAAAALAAVTQLSAQFTTLAAQVAKVLTAVQAIAKATTPAKKK